MEWFAEGGDVLMADLRDRLEQGICCAVEGTRVNAAAAARVPNTSNLLFEGIEGEGFVIAMDLKGISVSTGAACSSGATEPSHVLTAMGLSGDEARGSIRFSLGKQNTAEEVDEVLAQVPGGGGQAAGAESGVGGAAVGGCRLGCAPALARLVRAKSAARKPGAPDSSRAG